MLSRVPALASTAGTPWAWIRLAASMRASTEVISSTPARIWVSNRFGVVMVASGSSFSRSALSVSRAAPASWPLQMRTGSSTTLSNWYFLSAASTASMVAGVPSIPIFTASILPWTPTAASIWSEMTWGSIGTNRWTQPLAGSKETMQVSAVQPNTPSW